MLTTSDIVLLQSLVNAPQDGEFGPQTRAALKETASVVDTVRALVAKNGKSEEALSTLFQSRMLATKAVIVQPTKAVIVQPTQVADIGDSVRRLVLACAQACVGWSEKTGHNDGTEIDRILDSVGLKGTQNPYCAAFNYFCFKQAGYANLVPKSAWSPDWVAGATWTLARGGLTPLPGSAFGLFFKSQGRIAHTGLIVEWNAREGYAITIEGNTGAASAVGSDADREGQGVFKKKRRIADIHSVRDWIGKPKG